MREAELAEVVNLNRARKAKLRKAARTEADANRIAFGRSKTAKAAARAEADRAQRELDGAKREP